MNRSMLMLIRDESDIVPGICSRCAMDYATMKANISTKRPRHFVVEDDVSDKPAEAKDDGQSRALKVDSKLAEPVTPKAVAPTPAPASSTPIVAEQKGADQKTVDIQKGVAALEQALQKRMDDLCVKLEDLMANAGSLSIQMENGAGAFQNFT